MADLNLSGVSLSSRKMTVEEAGTQLKIYKYLKQQGYKRYAYLFLKFSLVLYPNMMEERNTFAEMIPDEYIIIIDPSVTDLKVLSLAIRHEILHQQLQHMKRAVNIASKKLGIDVSDETLQDLASFGRRGRMDNIAGDYEISNKGYTEADKKLMRHIEINGQVISGLVTEDYSSEWAEMNFEQLYDSLEEQYNSTMDSFESIFNKFGTDVIIGEFHPEESVFVDYVNGTNYVI